MNTLQELLDNNIELYTAEKMLNDYSERGIIWQDIQQTQKKQR